MCSRWSFCVLILAAVAGCESREATPPPGPTPTMAPVGVAPVDRPGDAGQTPLPEQSAGSEQSAGPEQSAVPQDPYAQEPNASEAPAAAPQMPPPGTERVVAEKGVGLKGRSLDEHEGVIVTPAKTYFTVRERIIFDITVPNNLKLFEATNGRYPRSHDEFMEQVIQANGVQLPQLPPGQRYVWDPETKELMVERPRQ